MERRRLPAQSRLNRVESREAAVASGARVGELYLCTPVTLTNKRAAGR
jgi:hypothetical protein